MKNKMQIILLFLSMVSTIKVYSETLYYEQEDTLQVVEVTAMRTKVASEKLRVVTTLLKDDIERMPVDNIQELLDYLPGVDMRTRGGNGVQGDISMRGGTFDQVIIMLNGINITDPQTGHLNMDIPIDISMIDRIEVLQGTSMNIFGLSAFSGAINIITGECKKNETKASVTGGDYGFLNSILGTQQKIQEWKLSGSASYNQSSGYIDNTDFKYGNVFLQAKHENYNTGNWNAQVGYQIKEYGANSFYSLSYPNQFEATHTLITSVSWDKRIGAFGIESSIYNRFHQDRYELYRDYIGAPASYTQHNHHITNVTGANIKGAWFSIIGKTAVGVEVRNENILSNVLGEPLKDNRHVPGEADSVMFTHTKNRLNINYFIEQSFYTGNFTASIGFAGNYNTMFGHNYAFGANAGYRFVRGGNVFVAVNRALRLPTFLDLYYKSPIQIANPKLLPEESLTAEIGLKYEYKGLKSSLSAYYRIGENIIDWVKKAEEMQWRSMNHSRVDAMGGEISVGYRYGYWLKNIEVSYSYCHMTKESGELISKYALDYLGHKLNVNISHGIYRNFGASWNLSFQQRNGTYLDKDNTVCNYEPVWLLDGRIYWQTNKYTIFIEATNILNAQYYDYGGIEQPGIWAKGGISISI